MMTSPPLPPLPHSGLPFGTYFSRRQLMQPRPPVPPRTEMTASSKNIGASILARRSGKIHLFLLENASKIRYTGRNDQNQNDQEGDQEDSPAPAPGGGVSGSRPLAGHGHVRHGNHHEGGGYVLPPSAPFRETRGKLPRQRFHLFDEHHEGL